ncbi:MAG TPA: dienelactone hydrolase family protein [Sphingomicrobium sp.]
MDPTARQRAITLYDRFTHEGMERRAFMAEMAKLAGSVAAAELMIAGIAAAPAAAAIVPENDKRLRSVMLQAEDGFAGYAAYVSQPRSRSLRPTVLVIHENRGLNAHIRDVARRLALEGFRAVAPDFLSLQGGTPANEDAARDMIGKLDLGATVSDTTRMLGLLAAGSRRRKVGAVGFCWGGGFVNRLAVAAGDKLEAGVSYYGPAPDPSEAAKVQAAMLIHDAGLDDRVNRTSYPWVEALRANHKRVTFQLYDGVNHAFNNDTSAERYNQAAAELAWKRTIAFFKRYLR